MVERTFSRGLFGAALGLAFCVAGIGIESASATPQEAPSGGPIEHFAANNPDDQNELSAGSYKAILEALYDMDVPPEKRIVDYGRLNQEGSRVLRVYMGSLQKLPVSLLSRDEQLAYWLNFYNAASLKLVLDEFERLGRKLSSPGSDRFRSSNKMKVKSFYMDDDGPWNDRIYMIEGQTLSLNDIEHRIILAQWPDARVMYGLYCPARGCPALPPEPFRGVTVWKQLEEAAKMFVNREANVNVRRGGKVEVSSLYRWHRTLFPSDEAILAHIREVGGPAMQQALSGVSRISDDEFSWKLGGKPPSSVAGAAGSTSNRGSGLNPYQ